MYSFIPHDDNLIYKVPNFPLIDTEALLAEFLALKDDILRDNDSSGFIGGKALTPIATSAHGCITWQVANPNMWAGGVINTLTKGYELPSSLPELKKIIHRLRVYSNMQIGTPNITYAVLEPLSMYKWHVDENIKIAVKKKSMGARTWSSFDDFWTNDVGHNIVYHIPLISNNGCWFLYEHKSFHMPADGSLYKVDNNVFHTFLNAGDTTRIHILING